MGKKASGTPYAATLTNGLNVYSTGSTDVLGVGEEAFQITHDAINTKTAAILGRKIAVGFDIETAYTNGTVPVGGSATFTFDATASVEGSSIEGKTIEVIATDNEARTFTCRDNENATGQISIDSNGDIVATTHYVTIVTSGGTSIVATAHASVTTTAPTDTPTFAIGVDADATAVNLAACLNPHNELDAVASTKYVNLTQAVGGTAGNTTITVTDPGLAGITKTDFTGGTGAVLDLSNGDFELGATATETGDNFVTAVNHSTYGLGTTRMTTVNASGVITMTQVTTGVAGNTQIRTHGWDQLCSVNPPTYFSAGSAALTPNFVLQFSHNGADWGGDIVIVDDAASDVEDAKVYTVDLTDYTNAAPYIRFVFNRNERTVNTAGIHSAFYIGKT